MFGGGGEPPPFSLRRTRIMEKSLGALIIRWIRLNSKENQISTSRAVANQRLSTWIDKGIEFHSPDRVNKSFKARVGVPKLRARSPMTLQAHSLQFSLFEPSRVRLIPDRDSSYQNWYDLRETLTTGLSDDQPPAGPYRTSNLNNLPLSLHPHISPDGVPCLGQFSAPWSATIADSNIPALVNVSQSFLNNWTRVDCYWDINYYHRDWQEEGQHHHGIRFFKDYYVIRKLAEAINYDNHSRGQGNTGNHYRDFTDWYDDNKDILSGMKIDWETAFIAHLGYKKSLTHTIDTQDGDVRILKGFCDKMARVYRLLLNTMLDKSLDTLKIGIYPVAEEVLTGFRRKGLFSSRQDICFTIPPVLEDITYRLGNFNHTRSRYADLQQVLKSKGLIAHTKLGDKVPRANVFMSNSDVNQVLGAYIERSVIASQPFRTNAYRLLCFLHAIREYGNMETTHASVLPFDPKQMLAEWLTIQGQQDTSINKREIYGEQLRGIMMQIHRALLPITVTDIMEKYFNKMYCEVTRILKSDLTTLYKGVTNEYRKRRTNAYGELAEQDSGENQLSIDSF